MFTIVDFIKNIVSSLEFTEYVDNITQTSTETQFDTCRTHQVTKGNYIVINGIKYKVKDFELNTWISVSGVVPLPFDSYTILAPNFFNGTPMMVSNVLADIRDWKKKLPMVYLLEVIREQRFNSRTNKLDRISDLRIFFLMSSNFEDWDISQHYDLAIEPMDNFLNDFIHALRYNAQVGEFDEYETINRANFGVYISKPSKRSGKYEDNITKLIDENVSGVELRINLPIQKNPCFSFPPDCPVPTPPIPPPPVFENLYSLAYDGVDDILVVPYNSSLNVVIGNHSLSFWIKTTDGTTQIVAEKGSSDELAVWIASSKIRWAGANTLNSATNINDGNWKHIVFVADGSLSYIYVNGSLDATGGNKIQASANFSDFVMGARSNNSFNFLGNLDEIAIFNYALSSAQVLEIYNGGIPISQTAYTPVSWWRNGDPNGQASFPTIVDDGSASNVGEMINMIDTDIEPNVP